MQEDAGRGRSRASSGCWASVNVSRAANETVAHVAEAANIVNCLMNMPVSPNHILLGTDLVLSEAVQDLKTAEQKILEPVREFI